MGDELQSTEDGRRFAPEDTDFRLLRENSDGTGMSLQFDAFQVVFDGYNRQLRINLTGWQVARLSAWGWESARGKQ